MKAKRSLTSSFDHLLKRKSSKDEFGVLPKEVKPPLANGNGDNGNRKLDSDETDHPPRPRAGSLDFSGSPKANMQQLKSPMMDM